MSAIISVENLSKRYYISHRGREPYLTLRDTLMRKVRAVGRRITHPLSNSPSPDDAREDFWALSDINFEIFEGQSVGIIGRNGAGKSTLLKILSRITEPTKGRVILRARVASLLEVGTGFHPELTGRENVFLNGAILGMSKAEIIHKFDEIVAFAGVEKFLDTPVKHYSSGMRVRLAFAVAAHLDPEILIVDEVLSVGDLDFQKKCLGKMESTTKEGRTVLCVSHDLGAIHRICSRAILLNQGRIVIDAKTDDVVKSYVSLNRSDKQMFLQDSNPEKPISLRKVFYANKSGMPDSEFRYDEGLAIVVEYEVNSPVTDCCIWFGLRTADGTLAFGSADSDVDVNMLGMRAPGYYRTLVEIPEKWLNEGSYYAIIGITKYSPLTTFDRIESAHFTILDVGTPERARTGNSRPGILQPYLPWNTRQTTDA